MGACALILPASLVAANVTYNAFPSRIEGQAVLQQTTITATAPNLVEGREFTASQAVALDTSVTPPILYVADTVNNRILAWKNSASFTNGAFADLVIGQRDWYSTTANGPSVQGSTLSAGFRDPVSLAVDSTGNLYVADAGNNRILRFPQPFAQASTGSQPTVTSQPDVLIGQTDLTGASPNQGGQPSATTLALSSGGTTYIAGMAFDSVGDLWVSDPLNNRVLRFPKSVLQPNSFGVAADMVLGQPNFTKNTGPANSDPTQKSVLFVPAGLALDPSGRLYVADGLNRVLVFAAPTASSVAAIRIMGAIVPTPQPITVNATQLGNPALQLPNSAPNGVVLVGANPYVFDTANNRILGFLPLEQWPCESVGAPGPCDTTQSPAFSPTATVVVGQSDFTSNTANRGLAEPTSSSLSSPSLGTASSTDLYVADSSNNRVLDFPISGGKVATSAARVLGQVDFPYNAPNLIEGREFFFFAGTATYGGIAAAYPGGSAVIDTSSTPAHLYVADPGNNRILGFADYSKVGPTTKADIVIGQGNENTPGSAFYRSVVNFPLGVRTQTNDTGLNQPQGLAVDSSGNLWVADTGNSRVLRFPQPFNQASGALQHANVVLGQSSFSPQSINTDPSSHTMKQPYGVAVMPSGAVAVSDIAFNRVLLFTASGGNFTNGQTASAVFGQSTYFNTAAGGVAANGLNSPRLLAADSGDNLYVTDPGNGRVAIYSNASSAGVNPAPAANITGLNAPNGVSISPSTGNIWVANTFANSVIEYPTFIQFLGNPAPIASLGSNLPIAVALDPFGNPAVAESPVNRMAFYYPLMDSANSANYFPQLAPGMLASLFAYQNHGTTAFGSGTDQAHGTPLPTKLANMEVLVNGKAAPLLYASPSQINFQVPNSVPPGSPAEVDVVNTSTGQIYTSALFNIQASSPALFTSDASGTGQVAAINAATNTVNSSKNPVQQGQYISLFGTGQGFIANAPPDGTAPSGAVHTATKPFVSINLEVVPSSDVEYSGLAPGFVGLWQINAKVPADAAPGADKVFVGINGYYSATGGAVSTTIYVTGSK